MDCRIGARMGAQVLRKKGGILSGPGALVTSRVSSSFRIPSVEMSRSGMGGEGLSGMVGVIGFSCVNTEWNCVLSSCALCSGVVKRVLLLSFNADILDVSCLRALKNLKKCLVLFLTLSARYLLMCSRSAFFMFLANVFWNVL